VWNFISMYNIINFMILYLLAAEQIRIGFFF
jgi:hypothetical protein